MNRDPHPKKPTLRAKVATQYSGALTPIALSAVSAWLIVTGFKGLAGFAVNRQSALADLIGILIVVAVARWFRLPGDSK